MKSIHGALRNARTNLDAAQKQWNDLYDVLLLLKIHRTGKGSGEVGEDSLRHHIMMGSIVKLLEEGLIEGRGPDYKLTSKGLARIADWTDEVENLAYFS